MGSDWSRCRSPSGPPWAPLVRHRSPHCGRARLPLRCNRGQTDAAGRPWPSPRHRRGVSGALLAGVRVARGPSADGQWRAGYGRFGIGNGRAGVGGLVRVSAAGTSGCVAGRPPIATLGAPSLSLAIASYLSASRSSDSFTSCVRVVAVISTYNAARTRNSTTDSSDSNGR
jgi:hypothetical protein